MSCRRSNGGTVFNEKTFAVLHTSGKGRVALPNFRIAAERCHRDHFASAADIADVDTERPDIWLNLSIRGTSVISLDVSTDRCIAAGYAGNRCGAAAGNAGRAMVR